ncbi:MAG: cobalamin-dependent protein [bacterium]
MTYNPHIERIMFIFPPSTSLASWEPMVATPMGIAYLGAATREAGYDVRCLDTVVEAPYRETEVNEYISRFGLTYNQIIERVREYRPQVVGLSCIFSNQWPAVRELTMRLKAMDPDIIVMSGGAHPTFMARLCMNDAPLDFIIKGESEHSFLDLVDKLRNEEPVGEVDGIVYRDADGVRENPKTGYIDDLDALPFPAHDLLDPEKYFKTVLPMGYTFISPRNVPVVTTRGCPCRCTFCSSTHFWGNKHRTRSAENVLKELDWLHETFGVKEIKFQDDNLTILKDRAQEIFKGMIERPYKLIWNTPNGIATWTLDEETIRLMKESGCYEMTMAIESGNQEVLSSLIKKPLKLDKVREINRLARDYGISRAAYFIIGFPGETKEQIMDTVRFSRELKLESCVLFIFNPLPGSELFRECLRRGYITEESFFEEGNQYFSSVIDSEEWTAEELESLIRWEWLRNYFAIFYSPFLVGRRYYKYLRHRPSFVKFLFLRTMRALKLRWKYGKGGATLSTARE